MVILHSRVQNTYRLNVIKIAFFCKLSEILPILCFICLFLHCIILKTYMFIEKIILSPSAVSTSTDKQCFYFDFPANLAFLISCSRLKQEKIFVFRLRSPNHRRAQSSKYPLLNSCIIDCFCHYKFFIYRATFYLPGNFVDKFTLL